MRHNQWTPEKEETFCRLRVEDGLTIQQLMDYFRCSRGAVERAINRLGLQGRKGAAVPARKAAKVQRATIPRAPAKRTERDRMYLRDPAMLSQLASAATRLSDAHDTDTLATLMGLHPDTLRTALEARHAT